MGCINITSGPTKFIKGSHVAGRRPENGENHFEGMPAQSLNVKAGDCVMFRSDVWHRGSRNLSNSTRHILQVSKNESVTSCCAS